MARYLIECAQCGSAFAHGPRWKYCSPECLLEAKRQNSREWKAIEKRAKEVMRAKSVSRY